MPVLADSLAFVISVAVVVAAVDVAVFVGVVLFSPRLFERI